MGAENNLELEVAQVFSNLGWNVTMDSGKADNGLVTDLQLVSDGKVCGYVEVFSLSSREAAVRKKERVQKIVKEMRPDFFILTNGVLYDVFFDGNYVTSMTVPPSPERVAQMRRLAIYYSAFRKGLGE